jgi:hypothetical protein
MESVGIKKTIRRILYPAFTFLVVTSLIQADVTADSWALPKKQKYYSPNKRYYVEITPKKLESQLAYFEDKVNNRANAGAAKDVKDNRAKAKFYVRRSDGTHFKKVEFPLVNEVSPVAALVSNDGRFVVTFDNWHSVGYGDDVVVIYRTTGDLVRKFALQDLLTEGDIEILPHSTSSIWWGGDHYVDDAKNMLVLKIVSNRKSPWEGGTLFHELNIDLATGNPKEPKRDLFPQPRVFASVAIGTVLEPTQTSPSEPVCASNSNTFDTADAVRVSSEEILAHAKDLPLPPYPAIAKAARVEGSVNVELLISAAGEVLCVRSLSGHPLLRGVSQVAVMKWKFQPFNDTGQASKRIGVLAVNFKITEQGGRQSKPN